MPWRPDAPTANAAWSATASRPRATSTAVPIAPGMKASGASRTARPEAVMIRKLKSGQYRLYSRKINPKTGERRNLGTFPTRAKAEKHERAVQYFKHHG